MCHGGTMALPTGSKGPTRSAAPAFAATQLNVSDGLFASILLGSRVAAFQEIR